MRNRNLILILTVLVATFLLVGCGQMRQLTQAEKDRLDNIRDMLEMAEAKGARECAPKEYAIAKVDLEKARLECTQSWEKCDAGEKPKAEGEQAQKSVDVLFKKLQECEDKKKIPTCGVVVEPETIAPGKCATIKWSGENVEKILFGTDEAKAKSPELPLEGTKEVCPKESTEYQFSCVGKYSTNYEFAAVKVEEPKPVEAPAPAPAPVVAPAAPAMKEKVELHINFDTNKAVIKKTETQELQKAVDAVKKYPNAKINVVGYTDSRGSAKLNQKLSEQRAEAVKKYLVEKGGVKPAQITSEGKGAANPIADNKTKAGQAKNRRVEVEIVE
jgi:outer membrane protein OmpA-like peptidoglycan-associated protein